MTRPELIRRLRHRLSRDSTGRTVGEQARLVGADVWLVGGYIRDTALGRRPHDLDLAAGRGIARFIEALQSRWKTRGFRFRRRGVTTWRFAVGRAHVDVVDCARRGLEGDLRRRELTINAVALDLRTFRLVDPLGGLADLRAGRLRLPRPGVLREDPLRALRLARFLAQLPDFRLAPGARLEAAAVAGRLRRSAVERVREELEKLLVAVDPRRGLTSLVELGLLAPLLPELTALPSCRAGRGRPDVWTHTLETLAVSTRSRRYPGGQVLGDPARLRLLRWALLLHDISKPETLSHADDGRPTFHGHETLGARRADALLRRLRLPRTDRRRITRIIEQHLRPSQLAEAGAPPRGLRRLVREAEEDLPILVHHAACDALGSGGPEPRSRWRRLSRVLRRLLELGEQRARRPLPKLLNGRDLIALGVAPGPGLGRLLRQVGEEQEAGDLQTRDDALRRVAVLIRRDQA